MGKHSTSTQPSSQHKFQQPENQQSKEEQEESFKDEQQSTKKADEKKQKIGDIRPVIDVVSYEVCFGNGEKDWVDIRNKQTLDLLMASKIFKATSEAEE